LRTTGPLLDSTLFWNSASLESSIKFDMLLVINRNLLVLSPKKIEGPADEFWARDKFWWWRYFRYHLPMVRLWACIELKCISFQWSFSIISHTNRP
jgi:hypothetical protein